MKTAFMKKLNEHIEFKEFFLLCGAEPFAFHFANYYRTTVLPVILYVYETWPLILREEHSLRMLEKRVLRKIFGPKKEEVTGGGGVL